MNLAQRLVGLTVLVLTIAVIGFTNLPRNLGKDAVWGAGNSAQQLHLVGGATLTIGGELRIRHVALDGRTQSHVVKVPAGQARGLATLGITLPAPPADSVTEISLYAGGTERFRSVPVISGTKEIYLRPASLLGVMNNPFVCTSAKGNENLALFVDPENHAVALHLASKGDGADLPSLFAVSDTQWQSETGQTLRVDKDGTLIVHDAGIQIACTADPLWGKTLPVQHQADGQYFYADAQALVFFDVDAKPVSMTVQRSLTETSWNAKDSRLTMWADNEDAASTLTFTVEPCAIGGFWGLQALKVVQEGPGGIVTQSCTGQQVDPFPGTWTGVAQLGQPIKDDVVMTLTPSGFYLDGKCAVYSGRLSQPAAAPFATATLQLAERRAKQDCAGTDSALDAGLAKAFANDVQLVPKGNHLVLRARDAASGHDPVLEFSRTQNLGT